MVTAYELPFWEETVVGVKHFPTMFRRNLDPGFGFENSRELFEAPSSLSKLRSTKVNEYTGVKLISNSPVPFNSTTSKCQTRTHTKTTKVLAPTKSTPTFPEATAYLPVTPPSQNTSPSAAKLEVSPQRPQFKLKRPWVEAGTPPTSSPLKPILMPHSTLTSRKPI